MTSIVPGQLLRRTIPPVRDDVPVVLLHGQPGSARDWARVVPLLTDHTLLVPDRPGYDGSPPGGFFHNARWLLDLLDRHGFTRAVIAGYSWGGGAALAAASLAPDRICSVALIGSVGTRDAFSTLDRALAWHPVGSAFGRLMRWFGPPMAELFTHAHGITLDAQELSALRTSISRGPAWDSWLVEQRALIDETLDLQARLSGITVPAVVLSATRDTMVPPQAGRALADALPNATLLEVAAGHLLPWEAPQAVEAAIRRAAALVPV